MNKTNIGIITIAAGFLLIWGGATGRLGAAWGALVRGPSSPPPSEPDSEPNPAGGGPINQAPMGGDGGRSMVNSLGINGQMAWQNSGSV